jgi:putative ABC transport system permease protein
MMPVLTDDRLTGTAPVAPPPLRDRSAIPTWRLAARLARRETRRRPGRTVLAALLIAVPVTAMTLGSVLVRTGAAASSWSAQFDMQWPGADIVVDDMSWSAGATDAMERRLSDLPAGTRVVDHVGVSTATSALDRDGNPIYVEWTDRRLDDPMLAGSVEIIDGRVPRDGEVLLDPAVAAALGLTVGDTLQLDRPSGAWEVVGIGRHRASYWEDLVVVPGFDRERIADEFGRLTTLIDLPDDVTPAERAALAARIGGFTRGVDPFPELSATGTALAWGWVGGVLALVAVGIIVAAAFATSARRQLVSVGQLASNGATAKTIRVTMALQGTWTAAVGAAVGIGLGLAVLPFATPVVEQWFLESDTVGYRWAAGDLVAIAVTALVAGTVAAAVPARSLAKVPVMAALAGRRPLAQPPRWLVPTGVGLSLGGLGLLAVAGAGVSNASSSGGNTDLFALAIVVASVAVVFGMVCATPLVVERAGRLAAHLPLSPRLALRSMARARTRSAAVVAAIAVAVGGSVAVAVVADDAVLNQYYGDAFLPDDALVVRDGFVGDGSIAVVGDVPDDLAPVDPPMLPASEPTAAQLDAIEQRLPGATVEPLLVAGFDPPSFRWGDPAIWSTSGEGPTIATPGLLELIGLSDRDRQTLDDQGSIMVRVPGDSTGSGVFGVPNSTYAVGDDMIQLDTPMGRDVPAFGFGYWMVLITEAHAVEIGFTPVPRGVIVRSDTAVTDEIGVAMQREFTNHAFVFDAFIEPGDPLRASPQEAVGPWWNVSYAAQYRPGDRGDLWRARAIIAGIAVVLSLLVVAIGLSLAAAEGRDERTTLSVVGATPATMRRQTATGAAALALTGIALGIPTGFVPTWLLWRAVDGDDWPSFPWVVSIILVIAIPLAASAATWLASAASQRLRPVTITPH